MVKGLVEEETRLELLLFGGAEKRAFSDGL